jgi:DNA-directed RNA polymerase specialized sigma24 family protein
LLVRALRDRDEQVFNERVESWSGMTLRLALTHLESRAIAEDVVQDAWLTVLRFGSNAAPLRTSQRHRRELCAVTGS